MLGGATQAMSVYIVEDPERSSGRAPWAAAPRPVGPGNVCARDWRTPKSTLRERTGARHLLTASEGVGVLKPSQLPPVHLFDLLFEAPRLCFIPFLSHLVT